ncbi:MAG: 50S ribosomal protein L25 [Bdellovibrionales bacterium]|nr:50S ribosomal protein L25 [Bdellovibrionales bacterium]
MTQGNAENASFTISAEKRDSLGKGACSRIRKEDGLPGVVYGKSFSAIPVRLLEKEFVHAASRALPSQVFELKSEDKELSGQKVIVREVQREKMKGKVLHVDLLALQRGERIQVRVPLFVTGEAPGVKIDGGVLTVPAREVTVFAALESIPDQLEVNVSELRLGSRIRAKDLTLPAGVTLKSNPEETIANILSGRALAAAEEEAAAAAASPAAAPAAGAEPAKSAS